MPDELVPYCDGHRQSTQTQAVRASYVRASRAPWPRYKYRWWGGKDARAHPVPHALPRRGSQRERSPETNADEIYLVLRASKYVFGWYIITLYTRWTT